MTGSAVTHRHQVEPAAAAQRLTRTAWIVGGISLLLVVAFDLGPPLAFLDDWVYAWDVRHFNPLHIHLYPSGSALALVQVAFGWLVTLGHADQRLLRLSEGVFILLAMYAVHHLSRRLGADATWSAIASVALLVCPVFAADATTFMSDVPYLGLISTAAVGAVRWLEGRRWIALCVAFATLATLQRQFGVAMPLTLTVALLLYRRDALTARDAWGLALLWAGCLAALAVPTLTGITTPTQGSRLHALLAPSPIFVVLAFMFLPGVVGLALLPFLPGLAMTTEVRGPRDRTRLLVFALILVEVAVFLFAGSDILPGDVFQPRGFNLTTLVPSLKPQLFPTPFFLGIEIGAAAAMAYLVRGWRGLSPRRLGWPGAILLLVAGFQFLPLTLVQNVTYDRYYLPIVVMLIPLAARVASGTSNHLLAGRLSLALLAVMVVVYCVGEQDLQAWELARDQTARLAYQQVSPYDVNAGYEANAVYAEVPWYERTGELLAGAATSGLASFSIDGPKAPKLVLQYARPGDPRPGYSWNSVAPGKIVITVP